MNASEVLMEPRSVEYGCSFSTISYVGFMLITANTLANLVANLNANVNNNDDNNNNNNNNNMNMNTNGRRRQFPDSEANFYQFQDQELFSKQMITFLLDNNLQIGNVQLEICLLMFISTSFQQNLGKKEKLKSM